MKRVYSYVAIAAIAAFLVGFLVAGAVTTGNAVEEEKDFFQSIFEKATTDEDQKVAEEEFSEEKQEHYYYEEEEECSGFWDCLLNPVKKKVSKKMKGDKKENMYPNPKYIGPNGEELQPIILSEEELQAQFEKAKPMLEEYGHFFKEEPNYEESSDWQEFDYNEDGQLTEEDVLIMMKKDNSGPKDQVINCPYSYSTEIGEINGQGGINALDALLIAQTWQGIYQAPADICCFDANQNGVLQIADALLVLQRAAGILKPFGHCTPQTTTCDGTEDGTTINPFEIYTCQDLQNIDNNLYANYELCSDIDCSGTINWNNGSGFKPIGGLGPNNFLPNFFFGKLEGNEYSINNLYINRLNWDNIGIFSAISHQNISGNQVQNLEINKANITSGGVGGVLSGNSFTTSLKDILVKESSISGSGWIGGITGYSADTVFSGISSDLEIGCILYSPYFSMKCAGGGGIVGTSMNTAFPNYIATISDSRSRANISNFTHSGGLIGQGNFFQVKRSFSETNLRGGKMPAGGLAGVAFGAKIEDSYSIYSSINTTYDSRKGTGGIVGAGYDLLIEDSYSLGYLINPGSSSVSEGKIIGFADLDNAAYVGPPPYYGNSNIDSSVYYNSQTPLSSLPACGTYSANYTTCDAQGKTTNQMKNYKTYPGWDFSKTWTIDYLGYVNDGYPYLKENLPF